MQQLTAIVHELVCTEVDQTQKNGTERQLEKFNNSGIGNNALASCWCTCNAAP